MTGRRSALATAERDTYKANRALRTAQAARRGPLPLAQHLARRAVAKALFRAIRAGLR